MPDLLNKKPRLDDLNPAEKLRVDELAALDQIEAGLRDSPSSDNDPRGSSLADRIGESENAAGALSTHDASSVGLKKQQTPGQTRFKGALNFIGKRKGITGAILTLFVGGGVLGGVFGPASMLINLTENLSIGNDSSSVAMERRFMKVFANATSGDGLCQGKIKCKMGKISNSALRSLSRKGITPIIDGASYNPGRTGYPSKNPTSYEITDSNGSKRTVPAAQMTDELLSDRRLASKVLGTAGAFNLRVRAWTGNHIDKRLLSKGISKNGGLAADQERGKSGAEREKSLRDRTAAKAASSQAVGSDALKAKVEKQLGPAKKRWGWLYGSCSGVCCN